jgi:alkanesulfonate monooxygenase SsuD/methylene tetrahydromethanopterin reductase-like flavin-dependent oxidoreductase (luciferase family)
VASARGHQIVVGTAEQVADHMIEWVKAGAADGFNIMPVLSGGFDDFTRGRANPASRGAFRREYEGRTLRDHLELPYPDRR